MSTLIGHPPRPLTARAADGGSAPVQMVIPNLTENYGATRDPPEKSAPMCTLHSFPHNIDHCLTWARSEFEGNLENHPKGAWPRPHGPPCFVMARFFYALVYYPPVVSQSPLLDSSRLCIALFRKLVDVHVLSVTAVVLLCAMHGVLLRAVACASSAAVYHRSCAIHISRSCIPVGPPPGAHA